MRAFLINIMYIMSNHREPRETSRPLSYLYHVTEHITAQPVGRFHPACGSSFPDPEDAEQLFERLT